MPPGVLFILRIDVNGYPAHESISHNFSLYFADCAAMEKNLRVIDFGLALEHHMNAFLALRGLTAAA